MRTRLTQLAAALAVALAPQLASSQTLLEAFESALENDANYRAALANERAGEAEKRIGRAGLLPQVSASVFEGKSTTDRRAINSPVPFSDTTKTDVKNNVLSLQQPIFNVTAWARYSQAELIAQQAEVQVFEARNNLAVQVTGAYLDILAAIDQLKLSKDETRAFEERFKQVESGVRNGEFSETDVLQARAQFDVAAARELEANEALNLTLSALENLTGMKARAVFSAENLQFKDLTKPQEFPVLKELVMRSSPAILAAILDVRIAQAEVRKQTGGHYPTLDFVARKVDSESDSVATLGQAFEQTTYALQMQVPIFQGLGVSASIDKASAGVDRAQAQWDLKVRETLYRFQEQFSRYAVAQTKLNAFERAVQSGETALKAVELGTKFGVNTLAEVLDAQRTLNTARRDYSRVLYESLGAWVQLRGLTGKLNMADLEQLSQLISQNGTRVEFERPEVPVPELIDPSLFEITPFNPNPAGTERGALGSRGKLVQPAREGTQLAKQTDEEGNTTYSLETVEVPLNRPSDSSTQ